MMWLSLNLEGILTLTVLSHEVFWKKECHLFAGLPTAVINVFSI